MKRLVAVARITGSTSYPALRFSVYVVIVRGRVEASSSAVSVRIETSSSIVSVGIETSSSTVSVRIEASSSVASVWIIPVACALMTPIVLTVLMIAP